MKHIILFLPVLSLLLSSCRFSQREAYQLVTSGDNPIISPDFPKSGKYPAGHIFRFKVKTILDGAYYVYLNDQRMPFLLQDEHYDYAYYELEMPKKDSRLDLSSDLYFVDRDYALSEVFPWIDYVSLENLERISLVSGTDYHNRSDAIIQESTDRDDLTDGIRFISNALLEKISDNQTFSTKGPFQKFSFFYREGGYDSLLFENSYIADRDFSSFTYLHLKDTGIEMPRITHPLRLAFSMEEWRKKDNTHARYLMMDDLCRKHDLRKMSLAALRDLLGSPDSEQRIMKEPDGYETEKYQLDYQIFSGIYEEQKESMEIILNNITDESEVYYKVGDEYCKSLY